SWSATARRRRPGPMGAGGAWQQAHRSRRSARSETDRRARPARGRREAGPCLTPALHALKYAGLVDEPASLVHREPVENEAHLLVSELPRLAFVVAKVACAPADDLPADRALRQ